MVSRGGSEKPELYNLAADMAETKDLASSERQNFNELLNLYAGWNAEQAEPSAPDAPAAGKKAAKKAKTAAGN